MFHLKNSHCAFLGSFPEACEPLPTASDSGAVCCDSVYLRANTLRNYSTSSRLQDMCHLPLAPSEVVVCDSCSVKLEFV